MLDLIRDVTPVALTLVSAACFGAMVWAGRVH
jgi:hypothetical protein